MTAAKFVIKIPDRAVGKFAGILKNLGAKEQQTKGKYELARFTVDNASIIIYTTGKLVSDPMNGSLNLIHKAIKQIPISFFYPEDINPQEFDIVIGSDETGKGEWLGPLVIAAVAIKPEQVYDLLECGVMDSKILSKSLFEETCSCIRSKVFSRDIVTISPKRFNELSARGGIENLNHVLDWAHGRAVMNLYMELYKSHFNGKILTIIDEFGARSMTRNLDKIRKRNDTVLIREKNAERYTVVAAASILSKCVRNNWINSQLKKLGVSPDITPEEALKHPRVKEFAKIQYLKTMLEKRE